MASQTAPNHLILQKQLKENANSRNKTMNRGSGDSSGNLKDVYQTMGLPQIIPNQGLYYNQNFGLGHHSPDVARGQAGNYPDNAYVSPNLQIQNENNGGDARVLMASPIPITAAGFPSNHHKIKKFSRETNYESDFSIIETEGAFPQQPSSGETMDYKYKKNQQQQQQFQNTQQVQPNAGSMFPQMIPIYNNQPQQQQHNSVPVLSNIVNGQYTLTQQQMDQLQKQAISGDQNGYPNKQQSQNQRIGNPNSRAARAAQLAGPLTQLGTVAELYTDTNYSGDTNNALQTPHSQKVSERQSNSFKEFNGPQNQHIPSPQSKQESGTNHASPYHQEQHRQQKSAVNSIIDDLQSQIQNQVESEVSQNESQGIKKQTSLTKRMAIKQAMKNSGKQYQLVPSALQHQQPKFEDNLEEVKQPKPNPSMRSALGGVDEEQQQVHQPVKQNYDSQTTIELQLSVSDNHSSLQNANDKPAKQMSNRLQANKPKQEEKEEQRLHDDYDQPIVVQETQGEKIISRSAKNSNIPMKSPQIQDAQQTSFAIEEALQSLDTAQAIIKDQNAGLKQDPIVDKELNDIIMLIGAHKTLKRETGPTKSGQRNSGQTKSKGSGQNFRKKKHDMVFRQMTYVHESALREEQKTFQADSEYKRDFYLGGIGSVATSFRACLLSCIKDDNTSAFKNFLQHQLLNSRDDFVGKIYPSPKKGFPYKILDKLHQKVQFWDNDGYSQLEKIGLGSVQLLKMIPRIISDTKTHKGTIHRAFIHPQGNTKVKIIPSNDGKSNKCFQKRSGSFPRIQVNEAESQFYSQQTNLIAQKIVKRLIDKQLLDKVVEDQLIEIPSMKRSNSYEHYLKLGKMLPKLALKAPTSRKLDELFPQQYHSENNTNLKQSIGDDQSSMHRSFRVGNVELQNNHQTTLLNVQQNNLGVEQSMTGNRYEDGLSSLQSSMEDDHDNNKLAHSGIGGHGSTIKSQGTNLHARYGKRRNTLISYKKQSSMRAGKIQVQQPQALNNSIFTLGDYKGNMGNNALEQLYNNGPGNGRIISKEKVEEIDDFLSQALKGNTVTPKQIAIQSLILNAIKDSITITVDGEDNAQNNSQDNKTPPVDTLVRKTIHLSKSIILKSSKLQRIIETNKVNIKTLVSQQIEIELMTTLSNEQRILKFRKFFLMPRESSIQIPQALLNSITSLQKVSELKSHLQIRQNSARKLGNSQTLNVICDSNLSDLQSVENKILFSQAIKRYDVLIDSQIFNYPYYFYGDAKPDSLKGQSLTKQQQPLIIKFRGTIQESERDAVEDSSEHSTVIISFLRERYLSDFTKYSKHLTQRARPTSRYYNSHQVKDLAMLSMTGGFSREHKSLPHWKVHNNQELLHFQVAQLRRAYSNWLNRQSMNEDIKRTLFQSKAELLLNNVRACKNVNLISPQLLESTIDKICQLCCKPEDKYKLDMILGKSGQQNQNGQITLATTGGIAKTQGTTTTNNNSLNHSQTEDSLYESAKVSTAQGLDETQAEYNQFNESVNAIYLHNHPAFITYNQDLEVADNLSIDSFIPMRFRMSTLFGYKTKLVRDGLYEVFEPVADARYLLAIAFKRAFMIKREQRSKTNMIEPAIQPSYNQERGPKNAVRDSQNKNSLQVNGGDSGSGALIGINDQQHLQILNASRRGSASKSPVRIGGN